MHNRRLTEEQKVALENLIDCISMRELLEALGEICAEKAEHIKYNWQDTTTALPWLYAASRCRGLSTAVKI